MVVLTTAGTTPALGLPVEELEAVARHAADSHAAATRRAYHADWAAWASFCHGRGAEPLPADPLLLAVYLSCLFDQGAAPVTVTRRLSGIAHVHRRAGLVSPSEHPGVRDVLRGIRRGAAAAGYRPTKARAVATAAVRAIVEDLPPTLAGDRDRALVLTGFALGLRASDLVWLDVMDVEARAGHRGLDVRIRHSKTDQDGAGEVLALAAGTRGATCPVAAMQTWIDRGRLDSGPLFRSVSKGRFPYVGDGRLATSSVTRILRRAANRAGVDAESLSAHSLRRGYATVAYASGVPEREIARTGRWRSTATMRSYDDSSRWAEPASARLGL